MENKPPRTYGLFTKTQEDPTRCIEAIHGGDRWPRFNQCSRKRGFGPTGEYCKIHSPEAVKARAEKREVEYKRRQENSPYIRAAKLQESLSDLRQIAKDMADALQKINDRGCDEECDFVGYKSLKAFKSWEKEHDA